MTGDDKELWRRGVIRMEFADIEGLKVLGATARIIASSRNYQTGQDDHLIEHPALDPIARGDIPPVYAMYMAERGQPHFRKVTQ